MGYPVPVVRVNSRFVDKFFFLFLSYYFFTLAGEGARFTSVNKKKRNKKRTRLAVFTDALMRSDRRTLFFLLLLLLEHFTQTHQKAHKTIKDVKPLFFLFYFIFCRVSLCVSLSSRVDFFLPPGSSFSFLKKLEISTERKRKRIRSNVTNTISSLSFLTG